MGHDSHDYTHPLSDSGLTNYDINVYHITEIELRHACILIAFTAVIILFLVFYNGVMMSNKKRINGLPWNWHNFWVIITEQEQPTSILNILCVIKCMFFRCTFHTSIHCGVCIGIWATMWQMFKRIFWYLFVIFLIGWPQPKRVLKLTKKSRYWDFNFCR